jgi:hypothetical protein
MPAMRDDITSWRHASRGDTEIFYGDIEVIRLSNPTLSSAMLSNMPSMGDGITSWRHNGRRDIGIIHRDIENIRHLIHALSLVS